MSEAARKIVPGVICSNCHESGHNRRSCANPPARKTCTNCGKEASKLMSGSTCRSCYDRMRRPSNGFPATMTCSFCSKRGHNIRGCPERRADGLHALTDKELSDVLNKWLSSTTLVSGPRRKLLQEISTRLRVEAEEW